MTTGLAGSTAAQTGTEFGAEDAYVEAYDRILHVDDLENADVLAGQTIAVVLEGDNGPVELRAGSVDDDAEVLDIERVTTITDPADPDATLPAVIVETDDIESDDPYHLHRAGADGSYEDRASGVFWVVEDEFDVSVADSTLYADESTTVTFESDRSHTIGSGQFTTDGKYFVNVSATGLDVDDLEDVFADGLHYDDNASGDDDTLTLGPISSGEHGVEASFDGLDRGEYTLEFDVHDTNASAEVTVEVTTGERERALVGGPFEGERGDLLRFTIDPDGHGESVLRVGDADDTAYEAGLTVTTGDEYEFGDEIEIVMNTHVAGGGGASDAADHHDENEAFWAADEDQATVTLDYVQIADRRFVADADAIDLASTLDAPLETGHYELRLGDEWNDDVQASDVDVRTLEDTTVIDLGERTEPESFTTTTAPRDDTIDSLESFNESTITETDLVANGDHLLVAVEDFGVEGMLRYLTESDRLDPGLEDGGDASDTFRDEGIVVEMVEQGGLNTEDTVYSNYHSGSPLPLAIEAVGVEDYDGRLLAAVNYTEAGLEAGETYNLSLELTEASPYVDDEANTVFFEERITIAEPELEWHDGAAEVPAIENARVTGRTTLAPGTVVPTSADAPRTFIAHEDATVQDDRSYVAHYDFRNEEIGTEFTLSTRWDEEVDDEIDAVLVEGGPAAHASGIDLDVSVPETISSEATATAELAVTNYEYETVTVDVTLEIAGETFTSSHDVVAGGTETAEFEIDAADLGVGDHEWSATASSIDHSATASGTVSVTDDTDGSDRGGDEVPGFGIALTLVAVLFVTTVARRRTD